MPAQTARLFSCVALVLVSTVSVAQLVTLVQKPVTSTQYWPASFAETFGIESELPLAPGSGATLVSVEYPVGEQKRFAFMQAPLAIYYHGQHLEKDYVADLLCFGTLIAELKALDALSGTEEAQLLNDLKATGLHVGLLLNFNVRVLRDGLKRIVHDLPE